MALRLVVMVVVAWSAGAAVALGGASAPAVRLSSSGGPSIAVVTVSGSGFRPGEAVGIRFDAVLIGSTRTDATGTLAAVAVPIPPAAGAGVHMIAADGAEGDAAQAPFTVRTVLHGSFAIGRFVPSALRSRLSFAVY